MVVSEMVSSPLFPLLFFLPPSPLQLFGDPSHGVRRRKGRRSGAGELKNGMTRCPSVQDLFFSPFSFSSSSPAAEAGLPGKVKLRSGAQPVLYQRNRGRADASAGFFSFFFLSFLPIL